MKVLIADPISKIGISILEDSGLDTIYAPDSSQTKIYKMIKDVDGLIVRSGTVVDSKMINYAEKLQVIGRAGVGVDNINISTATRKGIVVMNTPDVNTISAAEHTVALILTLSRNIHLGHNALMKGHWNRHELIGTELQNKILGIIGLGKIGKEVMDRCRSFGMKIIVYDPYINHELYSDQEVYITNLDDLVKQADYITLHIPLNENTKNLFDYKRLKKMKPSSHIINVSRGGIINEYDLAKALNERVILGAAIDVFAMEPINHTNPLLNASNILLSPHLGASTAEAKEGVSKAICEQISDYLLNEKLSNALNVPIGNISLLNEIKGFLDLSELLGNILSQIINEPIEHILIECQGSAEEIKPISLAFIKGILEKKIIDRINYVNSESIAKEMGIEVELRYSNTNSNYHNIITSVVKTRKNKYRLSGSVFDDQKPRLINVFNRKMEVNPVGTMLFLSNIDVPGVIGKVGTLLGKLNINIAAYLLNRDLEKGKAFSVLRLDKRLDDNQLEKLRSANEVEWVNQINI